MSDDRNQQGGGEGSEGMSKEEWLRQNPGTKTFDPEGEEVDEGMSKEDYLRKTGGSGSGGNS